MKIQPGALLSLPGFSNFRTLILVSIIPSSRKPVWRGVRDHFKVTAVQSSGRLLKGVCEIHDDNPNVYFEGKQENGDADLDTCGWYEFVNPCT